jgi:hypothetical protein
MKPSAAKQAYTRCRTRSPQRRHSTTGRQQMKVDALIYIWPLGHETTSVVFVYFRFSEILWWDSAEKFKVVHDANGTRTCRKRATHDRGGAVVHGREHDSQRRRCGKQALDPQGWVRTNRTHPTGNFGDESQNPTSNVLPLRPTSGAG